MMIMSATDSSASGQISQIENTKMVSAVFAEADVVSKEEGESPTTTPPEDNSENATDSQPTDGSKKGGKAKKTKKKTPRRRDEDERFLAGDTHSEHNLYIRGLSADTTDESLRDLCAQYGKITSAKAITDRKSNGTRYCKGYGFVMYENAKDAAVAVEALNQQGTETTYARVSSRYPSVPGVIQEDPTNLYFSNLPLSMDEQGLEALLSPFGSVLSSRILRKVFGESRGIGFCRMPSRNICLKIIENLHNKTLEGCNEPLICKFADNPINRRKPVRNSGGMREDQGYQPMQMPLVPYPSMPYMSPMLVNMPGPASPTVMRYPSPYQQIPEPQMMVAPEQQQPYYVPITYAPQTTLDPNAPRVYYQWPGPDLSSPTLPKEMPPMTQASNP